MDKNKFYDIKQIDVKNFRYKVYYRIWDGKEMINAYAFRSKEGVRKMLKNATLIDKIIDMVTGEEV